MERIFLDTTVLKATNDSDLVFTPRKQSLNWGGNELSVQVHDPVLFNQNTGLLRHGNDQAFQNRTLNRCVARLARDGKVELLISEEVRFEAMGVPRVGFTYFNSPIKSVDSPVPNYSLVTDGSGRDYLHEHISKIYDPRFLELQKLTGAFQGEHNPLQKNQLFDAYHIWAAECAGADYLLTHDSKLVKLWAKSKHKGSCEPIDAKELLERILRHRLSLVWPVLKEVLNIKMSGRKLGEKYQHISEVKDE